MQINAPGPSVVPQGSQLCNICLEDEIDPTTIKVLEVCKHVFHTECVEKWFKTQEDKYLDGTCPACRKIIRPLSDEKKEERDRQLADDEDYLVDFYSLAVLLATIARNRQAIVQPPSPAPALPLAQLPPIIFPLNIFFGGIFDPQDSEEESEDGVVPVNTNVNVQPAPANNAPPARNAPARNTTPARDEGPDREETPAPANRKRSNDDPSLEPDPKRKPPSK